MINYVVVENYNINKRRIVIEIDKNLIDHKFKSKDYVNFEAEPPRNE